jgi:hypothetical protein
VRRLLPWALLAASLSANLGMAVPALRRREPVPPVEPQVMSQLALDPDQRASIERLRSRLMASRHRHLVAMADLRQRLTAAIVRQGGDAGDVSRILRELAEAQAGYQCQVVDHMLAVRGVLRRDQLPRFEQMVSRQMTAGAAAAGECMPAPRQGAGP